jgi:hypothetical protein
MKRKTENALGRGHTTEGDIEAGQLKEDTAIGRRRRRTAEKKGRKTAKTNDQLSLIRLVVCLFKVTNIIKTKSIGKRKR